MRVFTFIGRLGLVAKAIVQSGQPGHLVIATVAPYRGSPMTDINKYLALRTALLNEKAKLEARLGEISKVLGTDAAVAAAPSPATTTTLGKRTFSAETKARMAAAQKARWAAKKSGTAVKAVAVGTPKQPKRKLSEATKAKMRAAHQARWAKVNAATAKAEK